MIAYVLNSYNIPIFRPAETTTGHGQQLAVPWYPSCTYAWNKTLNFLNSTLRTQSDNNG